ncbi:STAS domain-containing protein [Neobacillus jeddahensis]|uniref:STAS domain-containing protein n=1 Tax=Neobacillus jeddahensis TaxID=1461580 RepID=UPI00058C238B|nr:STAS domain-containing protein [Neobacillus jeddahensis]
MSLQIYQDIDRDQAIVWINGIMDITTVDAFHSKIEQLPVITSLLLDFSQLEFIDSTGIGAIVELVYLSQEKNFALEFRGIDENIQQIFDVLGLFTIIETLKKEGV